MQSLFKNSNVFNSINQPFWTYALILGRCCDPVGSGRSHLDLLTRVFTVAIRWMPRLQSYPGLHEGSTRTARDNSRTCATQLAMFRPFQ